MRNWPLFDLRLTTGRLELRIPGFVDLDALADLAADGVHEPQVMPFRFPWTDAAPAERARGAAQYHWRSWGTWKPEEWSCDFVVVEDGVVVGTQGMSARDFPVLREVSTGSWLGHAYQGRGIGTQMRAAVLHLAFAGLGAQAVTSGAFLDNPASLAVSRKLGYQPDGTAVLQVRGQPVVEQRLRLIRADWEAHRPGNPVEIEGLEPCLALFGLAPPGDAA